MGFLVKSKVRSFARQKGVKKIKEFEKKAEKGTAQTLEDTAKIMRSSKTDFEEIM